MVLSFNSLSVFSRALSLETTNVCESQNARGNRFCDTHLKVREAARRLEELDRIGMDEVLTRHCREGSVPSSKKFRPSSSIYSITRPSGSGARKNKEQGHKMQKKKSVSKEEKKKLLKKLRTLLVELESDTEVGC